MPPDIDLRRTILSELALSRTIVISGSQVLPRILVFAPDGRHVVQLELAEDEQSQRQSFAIVRLFMVWKAASGFTLALQGSDPAALSVIGVTREKALGALQPISHNPHLGFGNVNWFGRDTIGEEVIQLLPPKVLRIRQEEVQLMQRAFEEQAVDGIKWSRGCI